MDCDSQVRRVFRRLISLVVVVLATSCSTIGTKVGARVGKFDLPRSGVGHPFTGVRCEWMYLAAAGMAFPPALAVVLVDVPLSAVADVIVLPVDVAVASLSSRQPWSIDSDCGINLH